MAIQLLNMLQRVSRSDESELKKVKTILDKMKLIYGQLSDEESRQIFSRRVLYSFTGEIEYIRQMVQVCDWWNDLSSSIKKIQGDFFIFSAGGWGRDFLLWMKSCQGFIDNNQELWGQYIDGKPVYSLDEIVKEKFGSQIVIVNYLNHEDIKKQCIQAGIPEDMIIDIGFLVEKLIQSQYFDLKELPHSDDEVFVDVGCLNGGTSKRFAKWCNNVFRHIYCFEPEKQCFSLCNSNLSRLKRAGKVTLFNKGVYSCQRIMSFQSADRGGSHFSPIGDTTIEVITLDDVFPNTPVTFIKMDIEGAELDAIEGAENIIRRDHPKLAISVYHKSEDIFEIPAQILEFWPDYKFYLRHYSFGVCETVLYAI